MPQTFRLETQEVDLASLIPHPRNYRRHPDRQLDQIAASIQENGVYRPIVVGRGDVILAGHGVVEALVKRLNAQTAPVVRLDIDPESPKALRLLTGDNELSGMSEDDVNQLIELLAEVRGDGGLMGTGFDDARLNDLLDNLESTTRPPTEDANDPLAEYEGMPEYVQEPVRPHRTMIVHFYTPEAVEDFKRLIAQDFNARTRFIYHPELPRERHTVAEYVDAE